jgi:hypothetical protein
MIAFSRLGEYGRFGNQLFQYAFLRTMAQRLGVKFYCPPWLGDGLFLLNDGNERTAELSGITKSYVEPENNCGFNESALDIEDGTDILGFFQTEKYFNGEKVGAWYTFREEKVYAVREKYKHIDFSASTGMHLRFGDNKHQPHYIIAPLMYYINALSRVRRKENILVFSDEMETAREFLKGRKERLVYVECNEYYEDFYLMTLCRDFISSLSTFSWWAAWLNKHDDKIIVCPREWLRPGFRTKNDDLCCSGWTCLSICRPIIGNYRVAKVINFFKALGLIRKEFYEAG